MGEPIKIHAEDKQLPHQSGRIVGFSDNPRSYRVKTEHGKIVQRNRRALTKGKYFEEQTSNLNDLNFEQQPITNVKDFVKQMKETGPSHE